MRPSFAGTADLRRGGNRPAAEQEAQLFRKGLALHRQGKLPQARQLFEKIARKNPTHAEALYYLSVIENQVGRPKKALALCERLIALDPDNAVYHNNRGFLLNGLNRLDEALAAYDRAIRLQLDYATAHNNRGLVLKELDRPEEALAAYDCALTLRPDMAAVHNNRGVVLTALKRWDEALESVDRALALEPGLATAHNNRGVTLKCLDRLDESLDSFGHALALTPEDGECHFNRSQCWLLRGDFVRGWEEYSWRSALKVLEMADARALHRRPLPADLGGKHVVVVREMGLGDELFFLRFAPRLAERGARVTYLAEPRLVGMLDRAKIVDRVMAAGGKPGLFDLKLTVGDLPWLLGDSGTPTPGAFPIPAQPDREAALSAQLQAFGPPPYVGLTWRAGRNEKGVLFKEIPFDMLAGAVSPLGGSLVALQRRPDAGEIGAFARAAGKPVLDLTAANDDLEDMLALAGRLDFYVCVSNTNLHLRAARGRTSHVLVPTPPEFRWMADGAESPWFHGTRVFRQQPTGDWSSALTRLARELADR